MTILPLNVLELSAVRENPSDRCYHCKNAIFSRILEAAEKDGFLEVMDGTNASDDAGDRPGMRALRELRVLSPLRVCGVTKKALREYSRNAGLFTWNKPAYACLATRVPTGCSIDPEILKRSSGQRPASPGLAFLISASASGRIPQARIPGMPGSSLRNPSFTFWPENGWRSWSF